MATRACVKLLYRTVVRGKQTCSITSYAKLLTGSTLQLSRCHAVSANTGVCRRFSTETQDEGSTYKCVLQNLAWQTTDEDIRSFLGDVVNVSSIEIGRTLDGKSSGSAVVELTSQEDVEKAINLHKSTMMDRIIYVNRWTESYNDHIDLEAEATLAAIENTGFILLARGFPYKSSKQEILDFFGDLPVKRLDYLHNTRGLWSGAVFVEFESEGDMAKAMNKSGEYVNGRYVELKTATNKDRAMKAMPELSHYVKVLNLPYTATYRDIIDFFKGCEPSVSGVKLMHNRDMLPLGIAIIRFPSPRIAAKALTYSGQFMDNRDVVVNRWTEATEKESRFRGGEKDHRSGGGGMNRRRFQRGGSWDANNV